MLAVDLTMSAGTLAPATNVDAQSGVTLVLVDDELLAYGAATLTGVSSYSLTSLERGLHGTSSAAHSVGARFLRLDDAIFRYTFPTAYVGRTVYFKFQSFNIFGESTQDMSACAAFSYTLIGSGALGSVAGALSVGSDLDFGLTSAGSNGQADDFGLVSDAYTTAIDLGLASA
jgi:hypothetical protein